MNPLVVSYGFENYERLTENFGIPDELISRAPRNFIERLCHTLDLPLDKLASPRMICSKTDPHRKTTMTPRNHKNTWE